MKRELERPVFRLFRPVYSYAEAFRHVDAPALRTLCTASSSSPGTESNMAWLRGAGRFLEDFETAALLAINDNNVNLNLYIDDPWKLTGFTRDEVSETTRAVAWSQTRRVENRTASQRLTYLMLFVSHYGMAPPEIMTAARWFSKGKFARSAQFAAGWPGIVFGHYAHRWSTDDLLWLVNSGATPDDLSRTVFALIGNPVSEGVIPPEGGLPFSTVRLVLEEGVAPEYVKELLL
jgi:hypothetical protein